MKRNHRQHGGTRAAVMSILLLAAVSARSADEALRTFSDRQGRTFQGRITAFDAATQMVTIRRADGKTGNMPISVFAESDREHIVEWAARDAFLNGLRLAPRLRSVPASTEATGQDEVSREIVDCLYDVEFMNRSASGLAPVEVEYCIFYRQGKRDDYRINYNEGICYGTAQLEALAPGASAAITTKSVRLFSESGQQTIFGKVDFSDADVRGIWLKLRSRLPSGEAVEREYRSAQDAIWKWTPRSIGVGLNESDSPYIIQIAYPQ